MADRLPQELLIDILARLPVEDLVRFITVCKLWYSLITNPNFISIHIKRASANSSNNSLLLVRDYQSDPFDRSSTEQYSLYFDNDTFEEYKSNLGFPFKVANPNGRIIGCSNGVVCVSEDLPTYGGDIVLWNPFIHKSLTLPEPLLTYESHGLLALSVGFGFSPVTNDYKVVRVVHLCADLDNLIPPMVEVYELSVGCWRIVDSKGFPYRADNCSSQTFLNGAIHWFGGKLPVADNELLNVIVSFDLESELLGVVKLPDSLANEQWQRGTPYCILSKLDGSLAIFHHALTTYHYYSGSIWVMKQYGSPDSWTKLFTVDLTGNLRGGGISGYRKNGEALLSTIGRRNVMVSYDPKTKELKYLKEFQSSSFIDAHNFVESMALLGVKGGSGVKPDAESTGATEGGCLSSLMQCFH